MMRNISAVLIVAFIIALFLRIFVVEGFVVSGDSMVPTLESGDYVFVNKFSYKWGRQPQKNDVVVAFPRKYTDKVVKRVAGTPGEVLNFGSGPVSLDPGEYFLTGDNTVVSVDSRTFGPVDTWDIQGKVIGAFRIKTFKYIHF